jgi:hydroxymethylpyrimidine/phosphomethylpyrimidine kinase
MSSTMTPTIALTIAGSDSSGGAGIQADLKTFTALGVYGASVVTALTAQNTTGVQGVHAVPAAFIAEQMRSVLSDLRIGAAKTGMLATRDIVETVVAALAGVPDLPLIADPVMVATSGDVLLAPDAVEAVRRRLLPAAELITPNLAEAAELLGGSTARDEQAMVEQARALIAMGARAVLMKGGHATGREAADLLVTTGGGTRMARPWIETPNTHGTGCTLSAAIAALRAGGAPLPDAVARAKDYLWNALKSGAAHRIGNGHGPVDHLYAIRRSAPPV